MKFPERPEWIIQSQAVMHKPDGWGVRGV